MNRRDFLLSTAAVAALAPFAQKRAVAQTAATSPAPALVAGKTRAMKKGFMFATLNSPTAQKLSVLERFQLLSDAKFDGVEVGSA